jgi:hypothetical protein
MNRMKVRCSFMIPVAYNDGREVAPETIIGIGRRLDGAFRGYYINGPLPSSWEGQVELMNEYNIVLEKRRVPELRRMVVGILKELGQLAMYFEVHHSSPEITLFSEMDGPAETEPGGRPTAKRKGKRTNPKRKGGDTDARS